MQKFPQLEPTRSFELGHHVSQARAWLDAVENRKNSAFVSYAAFEIRLAVERICMQYYVKLIENKTAKLNPSKLQSFKSMQKEITRIVGKQDIINKQFEFARTVLKLLGINISMPTPNFERLIKIWADCSDPCHISWNLIEASGKEFPNFDPVADLTAYANELDTYIAATAYWFQIHDNGLANLRNRFECGENIKAELNEYLQKTGMKATYIPRVDSKHITF